ncbi:phosphotransferase [Paenibacillus sp. NFR01]|uniref:phosphotransferase n=1 Tax=Paenibacillus sp. NFR01 TaxID=1566279 RepID=UPI0008CA755C|nr:phosphotransferase [Paenibacillus sp. NFR01]SES88748.1 Phosphotransferase enzyme family protein [Paenibacillus sp. NFR01]
MIFEPNVVNINRLFVENNLDINIVGFQVMSGTTNGLIVKLTSEQGDKYVLKFDPPNEIQLAVRLLEAYQSSDLLPKIIFVAPDESYFVYSYTEGTTHFNRGSKRDWLTKLVIELLNKYTTCDSENKWGRLGYPRASWWEFNETSVEEAKENIGDVLTNEDYEFVRSQMTKLFNTDYIAKQYLLHGDTGVHNFVFDRSELIGVIDPSPMVGPLLYDFIYAFCSSPDDITKDTLFAAYAFLEQGTVDKLRLIDEVSIQLYCRIGLSIKHHPNDLPEYLQAWRHWREICQTRS